MDSSSGNSSVYSKLPVLDSILRGSLPRDEVLQPVDENAVVENIRKGLRLLGYDAKFGTRYDREFRKCVLTFQEEYQHDNQDGLFRPGTRRLLAQALIEKYGEKIFSLLASVPKEWDVFLSHASEDKVEIAKPLADALRAKGLRVWFDDDTLLVGDSLRRSIDKGLFQSRYGVVVISPAFLEKEWPQRELDGLATKEIEGKKVTSSMALY